MICVHNVPYALLHIRYILQSANLSRGLTQRRNIFHFCFPPRLNLAEFRDYNTKCKFFAPVLYILKEGFIIWQRPKTSCAPSFTAIG